jgi:hypothetical protein
MLVEFVRATASGGIVLHPGERREVEDELAVALFSSGSAVPVRERATDAALAPGAVELSVLLPRFTGAYSPGGRF